MDLPEFTIFSYHGYRCFVQHISQSLPSPVADMTFTCMFPGAVLYNRISCQLLQLLWVIKPAQVADLCDKSTYRFQPDPFNLKKFIYIDRKSTRLNSSHVSISYAVFCLK